MIFKILIILISGYMLLRSITNLSDRKIDLPNFMVWALVWLSVIVFTIHPTLADDLARFSGISRGTDVVFFLAFLILFYFVFRLYTKITAVENDVTESVKYIALINQKLSKEKKKR